MRDKLYLNYFFSTLTGILIFKHLTVSHFEVLYFFLLTYSTIRTFFSFQGEFDETSGESSPSPARYGAARVMHAPPPEDRNAKTVKKFRLRSLDTFRG